MIRLINLKFVEKGSIRAVATVSWFGIIIENIKVIQQGGQNPYVRLPEHEFTNSDGKKKYFQFLKFENEEYKKQLDNLILPVYFKELAKKEGKPVVASTGLNKNN